MQRPAYSFWRGVWVMIVLIAASTSTIAWAQEGPKADEKKKEAAPAGEQKAAEATKPAEAPKPAEAQKPAAPEAKPAEGAKPAEPAKPAEAPKPGEGTKPGAAEKAAEKPVKPEVEISNIRFVTGEYGPVVASPVFQPEEKVIVRYDINKFQTDVDGKSSLTVQHVLKSAADAKEIGTKEFDIRTVCTQGPPVIWSAKAALPAGTPPGKYYFEIKVNDKLIARQGSAKADFEIGPPKLAAVNARFTADRDGKTEIPPVFGLGQSAYLQFSVVGLKVDGNNVRCGISAEAQGPDGLFRKIFKAQPQPVAAAGANAPAVPITILLRNSMSGKTQINTEVHDLGGNATINLPMTYEVLKSN